ncbi:UNVERIFIED_CONTAM: hypothetical protein FKN15_021185 [Acipenser sinensis]
MSPENSLSVSFRSDFSNEERFTGFEAHYTAVDVDECTERNDEELACDHYCHNYIGGYYCSCRFGYILHSDNRTCRDEPGSFALWLRRLLVVRWVAGLRPASTLLRLQIEAEQELLVTFCGRENTDTEQIPGEQVIMSPENSLSVSFRSDFSNEERFTGFEAHYTAVVECSDNLFIERTGVITSSDFPNPYPKSTDCLYRIELQEGFVISLEFDDSFDIEDHPEVACPYDYLKIKAGREEFGPLCGERSPGRIETGSNSVQILFHSDNSGESRGWKLSYTAIKAGREEFGPLCGERSPGRIETGSNSVQILFHSDNSGESRGWKLSYTAVVVDCGAPVELEHGSLSSDSRDNLTIFGSSIQYSCQGPRYHMYPAINNSTYICGEKGLWVNEELGSKRPSCMAACGQPVKPLPALLKRIVGGRNAELGFFPWQALIMVEDLSRVPEDKWFGSGALLSESWVLTAAHILRSQRRDSTVVPVSKEHVTVYLGLHDVRNKRDAVNLTVEKIILHEDFDPWNYNNDIALVKLKEKVSMNPWVMPVCLPPVGQDSADPEPHTLGLVAGWGISNPNVSMDNAVSSDLGMVSDVLQYVKLPVVLHSECKTSYELRSGNYNITDNMFCAGFYEGGKDTCLGDSGGAFVMEDPQSKRWVAQGLVSWGGPEECGSQRVYGVYTKVSKYTEWLENKLEP